MGISFRHTFAAKLTHIIGFLIAVTTFFTTLPNTATADKLDVRLAANPTTESKKVEFVIQNKSSYAVNRDIIIDKFEKNVDGQWVEYAIHPLINNFPAIRYVFPSGCILPSETVDAYIYFDGLTYTDDTYSSCSETLEAGTYRITIGYRYKSFFDTSEHIYKSIEFDVLPE